MSFIGPHHAYRRKKIAHKIGTSPLEVLLDKGVYFIGLMAVAANVPQLWNIWIEKNTEGVSILSWTGFLIGSLFWFGYGLLHKEKPIAVINGFLIIIQSGIVLGLFLHS